MRSYLSLGNASDTAVETRSANQLWSQPVPVRDHTHTICAGTQFVDGMWQLIKVYIKPHRGHLQHLALWMRSWHHIPLVAAFSRDWSWSVGAPLERSWVKTFVYKGEENGAVPGRQAPCQSCLPGFLTRLPTNGWQWAYQQPLATN